MNLRRLGLLLALLLSVSLLAACGGKGAVPTPGSGDQSQPAGSGGSGTQSGGSGADGTGSATGGSEPAGGSDGQAQPAGLVKVGPLAEGAEADLGPLSFKLNYVEARSAGMTFPGYDFLTMNMTVTNKSQGEIVFNSLNTIQLEEPGGGTQRPNVQSTAGYEGRIDQSFAAGQSVTGWFGFLVQLADGKYRLVISVPEMGEAVYEFEAPPM